MTTTVQAIATVDPTSKGVAEFASLSEHKRVERLRSQEANGRTLRRAGLNGPSMRAGAGVDRDRYSVMRTPTTVAASMARIAKVRNAHMQTGVKTGDKITPAELKSHSAKAGVPDAKPVAVSADGTAQTSQASTFLPNAQSHAINYVVSPEARQNAAAVVKAKIADAVIDGLGKQIAALASGQSVIGMMSPTRIATRAMRTVRAAAADAIAGPSPSNGAKTPGMRPQMALWDARNRQKLSAMLAPAILAEAAAQPRKPGQGPAFAGGGTQSVMQAAIAAHPTPRRRMLLAPGVNA